MRSRPAYELHLLPCDRNGRTFPRLFPNQHPSPGSTVTQMTIEPTQLCLVVFDRSLVGLFSKPANRCVLPA
jgi:hypothetical protein